MSVPGTEFSALSALPAGNVADTDEIIVVRAGVPYRGTGAQVKSMIATDTFTLTNKRVTQRVATLTDAATVTPDSDAFDGGKLLTLSQATQIANPTGTPTAFQRYTLRIKSTTSRALTYGSQFRGSTDIALPAATTGSGKTDMLVFQWNADDSKWDLVNKVFGF